MKARSALAVATLAAIGMLGTTWGLLSAAVPTWETHQPRVCWYGGLSSSGGPFTIGGVFGPLDSTKIRLTARHQLLSICVDPVGTLRPDIAATIRFYNPRAKLVFYSLVQFHWIHPPSGGYDTTVTQFNANRWRAIQYNNGWLYGTDGQVWFDNMNVDFSNRVAVQAQCQLFRAITRTHIADGWWLDDLSRTIKWSDGSMGRHIDYHRSGFATLAAWDSAWIANTQAFIDSLRMDEHGWIGANQADGCTGLDGLMREGIGSGGGAMSEQQARVWSDTVKVADPWVKDENYLPYGSVDNLKNERRNLALAAMGHGWSFYGPNNDGTVAPYFGTWWFDEYSVTPYPYCLADATGGYVGWLGDGGDVLNIAPNAWLRWYEKGCVMLNLSDVPVTFNLTVTFKRIRGKLDPFTNNGHEGQSFTVPAHDALFVVRKPRPLPKP